VEILLVLIVGILILCGVLVFFKAPRVARIIGFVGNIMLGLGLLIGGIVMYVFSMDAANDVTVTAATSNNLAMGGIALAFGGFIVLVVLFFIHKN